ANRRLTLALRQRGLAVEDETFITAHGKAALRFLEESRRDGRETHNRFWISAALEDRGYHVPPDDVRISSAVDAYFSAFLEFCDLIPGTLKTLGTLRESYRLGLLSNFTHGPAARAIIDRMGLAPFFDVVLISGELGFRKPHALPFLRLMEDLGVENDEIFYIGDDPEPDISGARNAGLQPVWTTYVQDRSLPFAPAILSRDPERPDTAVPRISSWDDLFLLLDKVPPSEGPS
ncbi:MAG: HAD family hydrolase, partial [Desulfobacterales bacterium]|nr:HAD family hydrolase [Desulfobacterales bacterium]